MPATNQSRDDGDPIQDALLAENFNVHARQPGVVPAT
jgi:hypothetical protein